MKLTDLFPGKTEKTLKKGLYPQRFTNKVVFIEPLMYDHYHYLNWKSHDVKERSIVDKYAYFLGLLSHRIDHAVKDRRVEPNVHRLILLVLLSVECQRSSTFSNRVRHEGNSMSIAFDDVNELWRIVNSLSFDAISSCVDEVWVTPDEHIALFKEGKEVKPSTTTHKYKVLLSGYLEPHMVGSILNLFESYNKHQIDSSAYFRRRLSYAVNAGSGASTYGTTIYLADKEMLTLLTLTGVSAYKIIEVF